VPFRSMGGVVVMVSSKRVWYLAALVAVLGLLAGANAALAQSPANPHPAAPATIGSFEVVEDTDTLPGYTIFRPADLSAVPSPLPIIPWVNGGCLRTGGAHAEFLRMVASAGFFVAMAGSNTPGPVGFVQSTLGSSEPGATWEDQRRAIDLALAENRDQHSDYYGKLDPRRIAAAGMSCGGGTSVVLATEDERVKAVLSLDGGKDPALAAKVAVPVAWLSAGDQPVHADVPNPFGVRTDAETRTFAAYDAVPDTTPAYVAVLEYANHGNMTPDQPHQEQMAEISVNWLDLTLNRHPVAHEYVLGDPCGFCGPLSFWTTYAKNWDDFQVHQG
jgi:dienelactone hydrolase